MPDVQWIHANRTLPPTPLAGIDLNSGYMPVRRVFYFAGSPDVNRLQESLALALAQWPDFAGTISITDNKICLDRTDTGVRITIETLDTVCPAFGIDYPLGLPTPFCDDAIGQKTGDGLPVFTVKLSRYNDGHWVLGTCNSHALCDGSGYWQFMQSWRDAFHGLPMPSLDNECMRYIASTIAIDNVPAHLQVPPVSLFKQQMANMQQYVNAQLMLTQSTLDQLKTTINNALSPNWVSTQDALMALLWQTLANTSLKNGASSSDVFPLGNVINIRSHLGLKNYVGNMVFSVSSDATLAEIAGATLPTLALRLRQDSQQSDVAALHAHLAFMQQQLDQGHYNTSGYFTGFSSSLAEACVHGKGIMINNWSKFPAYDMDFSGAPVWFDLATTIPMHFAMVMPSPDGAVLRLFLPQNWMEDVLAVLESAKLEFGELQTQKNQQ
jgi:hypothetical protein